MSGIGPAGLLTQHGIAIVHDLPGVGENLMDHTPVGRSYSAASPHSINRVMSNPLALMAAGADYFLRQKGPLTMGAALAGGFAATRPGLEAPDVQIGFTPFLQHPTQAGALAKGSGFLLSTYTLRPESRGHVRIVSPDPRTDAAVSINPFSAESDVQTMLGGLKLLRRIAEAAPLRKLRATEVTPGLQGAADDEEKLLQHALKTGGTAFHYSGTARMGSDDMAVVDPSLRVRGMSKLRVIDASVMPTVVSSNTNAASIMIGEKGADLVKVGRRV